MFDDIDKEEDGEVYYREVVDYLRSVNQDMDNELNLKVGRPASQSIK
jgi:Ca2+-binding EF-hand superfamily protein